MITGKCNIQYHQLYLLQYYVDIDILYIWVECLTDGDTVLSVGQREQLHKVSIPDYCEEMLLSEGNVFCWINALGVGCLELVYVSIYLFGFNIEYS